MCLANTFSVGARRFCTSCLLASWTTSSAGCLNRGLICHLTQSCWCKGKHHQLKQQLLPTLVLGFQQPAEMSLTAFRASRTLARHLELKLNYSEAAGTSYIFWVLVALPECTLNIPHDAKKGLCVPLWAICISWSIQLYCDFNSARTFSSLLQLLDCPPRATKQMAHLQN